MSLIDKDKPVIPLSGVADMLEAKSRTLRMYEDKGLLPKHEGIEKKLYSINDINKIAFVHYIASVKKINANGIKYILELLENHMSIDEKNKIMQNIEKQLDKIPPKEIEDLDIF
ncbi:MerR family transcriptional regulator [Sulfurimonas sp. C5]|uniref:MerR family transcriptional regulator n=1 Tax=Sulfurimonas sp. C5 TaxID=3036947 RepID=UPI002453A663|nr:MerR family transcriptional regulator [Sulfurimonas sp. C5]MDH4945050.1 MerR family transcriptional regulator [Sulfurimonas sp. C5]